MPILNSKQVIEMGYSVYCHTNKTNGKKYIGLTKQKPERRWQKGYGYINTYFGNAIEKYGWDGFIHEVLYTGLTKEEACKKEIELIALYHTAERECGYNISFGGETCDAIIYKKGEEHPNHKKVKMIDPKTKQILKVFGSQSDAARELGISRKGITKACRGINATYQGYIWEYADYDYKKLEHNGAGNYDHKKQRKAIKMIDENGKEHIYNSIKEAAQELNIKRSNISRYILGMRNDSNGRKWSYAFT